MPPSAPHKSPFGETEAETLDWKKKFPWIPYDLQIIQMNNKMQKEAEEVVAGFLIDKFEAHVVNHPKKPMLIFEDYVYTYEVVDQQANRVAHAVQGLGLKLGDTVAIMIHNEPAFAWTLLGLQKLGVSVALVNYNLRLKALSRSVMSTEPKALIVGTGADLHQATREVLGDLQGLPVYLQGCGATNLAAGVRDFDTLMMRALPARPDPRLRAGMTPNTVMAYIYTSGTTGLPKPVYIKQLKASLLSSALRIVGLHADDVLYGILPLYHTAGGAVGLFGLLERGCTMVLRRKFSASQFWPECRKYNVTLVQYIGEIFRYILAQPQHELDSQHKVRAAFGNGMRKDIFEQVLQRFKIPTICEFYSATEGVSGLLNLANKPGAIGRVSPLLEMVSPFPNVLVKFDYATAMPVRDRNGRCIKVRPGETGLFMSRVPDFSLQQGELEVYKASKEANKKKLVRDAFEDGDVYFNYGDVFYLDQDYFVYFHDRIGDTFRWKAENVSTTEVANTLSGLDFLDDANVYGVKIPGHDGRAGMAALTLSKGGTLSLDQLKQIYKLCEEDLPTYARPLFLRVLPEAVLTGTFKQSKVKLVEEGYDMAKVKDKLYYLDMKVKTYSPLNQQALVSFLQSKL